MSDIVIKPVDGIDDLYCKYPNEFKPQPVELSLDIRTGVLRCDYDPNIGGGSTFAHHHRLVLAAPITCITAESANRLMQEVAPFAQRVLDGASEEWDGNNNVGRFTDDADNAWDEIADVCEGWGENPADQVVGWNPADWFSEGDANTIESLGLTADTTDEQLAALAAEQSQFAATGGEFGYALLDPDDVAAYLAELRDQLRETVREEMTAAAEALEAAELHRDELIRRVKHWGVDSDTWRAIGELAGGISHTQVGRIIKAASASDARSWLEENGNRYTITVEKVIDGVFCEVDRTDDYTSLGTPAMAALDTHNTRTHIVAAGAPWRIRVWAGHHAATGDANMPLLTADPENIDAVVERSNSDLLKGGQGGT